MAAASNPTTPGTETNYIRNKQEENARHPTVEELLIQIENHLYKNIEHRASLLIAVWSCLAGKIGCFRNMEKVFHMLYRESAMTIFCGHWPKVNLLFKRGLSRALIHFSHAMGHYIKGAEGLCSALVMAAYDPWGDPVIHKLLSKEDIEQNLVDDFIKSEPFELLVIRVECLVNARFEEAAIRLCRCCLRSHLFRKKNEEDGGFEDTWKWTFMEWLLRLLFRKGRLNDLVAESRACSCHDGVRLIYRTRNSPLDDSESLTETLINLFLVRDLLFQSNYCCTSELMSLWCDFQVHKQKTASEIQDAAQKLLIGHASSSAQFYLFVDILWGKFGPALLPLYIEMYVRGLTSDLNYLEAARQADNKEFVIEIENHMAAMYFKLSSMFQNINKEIALECMLSSFSLDPTKERLDWIKKLTLQISKERALKLAAAKNEACKHKLCSKSGCAYPHPVIPKKKTVIMCDQAIQVGDDSFENESHLNDTFNSKTTDTADSDSIPVIQEETGLNKSIGDKTLDISSIKENMLDEKDTIEQNCLPNSHENNETLKEGLESSPEKPQIQTDKCSDCNPSTELAVEVKENHCKINEKELANCTDGIISENVCTIESSDKNYVPHNGEICEITKESEKTNLEDSKTDCNHKPITDKKLELACPKNLRSCRHKESFREDGIINHNINENGFISNPEIENCIPENSTSSVSTKTKCQPSEESDVNTCKNYNKLPSIRDNEVPCNDNDQLSNNVCANGYDEIKELNMPTETDISQSNDQIKKIDDIIKNENTPLNLKKSDINTIKLNNADKIFQNADKILPDSASDSIENRNLDNVPNISYVSCDDSFKDECKLKQNGMSVESGIPLTVIEEHVIKEKQPFHHIVLDSKISGLSDDLLSDFVIVLESLRNKQLKSSCKWSQIKHLCENYLENVSHSRCMMLNMHTNGSVDSEADSVSEFTKFKGFESHESDDSVVEDHYADKSHVFKRFMHADENAEMTTYINLSDIHCPQIPLEKLFYAEHSSSHLIHKKRHKKHRNHDKNPEKVVLRKLRHSSRAEHDLVKRKKRKKRKGKRAKNHVKKHHFTHGKTNKDCLKNKKKKHKLKKKKEERNSGFISGDYCSDFSSAELMRLVKEHSHSYSKLPTTTSKHPRSIGSSSDEPARKKRKVTFDKKKQKPGKYHDKHKHQKSKSSKRKKKLAAIEGCPNTVKNLADHALHGKIDAVNDYSRIVQYSSVKKMEAVQIRQRSLALNLSKVSQEEENPRNLVNPCTSNSHLQQLVQQNFESSEDIMKMQLLMSQQQPDVMPISSTGNFLPSANNQAVLKYVCSKMTSHLLSVAQSSNCAPSDSEGSKSPLPTYSSRAYQSQRPKIQPQNLASNVKHVIIERSGVPYKLSSSNSSLAGTIIPVSSLPSVATSESRNLMGTVFSGGITYPATATSPQVTTFTIPVAHSSPGSKLVASKIVIPINQCSNIRTATPTPIALPETDTRSFASTSSTPPISGVIIVKNGNNTQIISGVQQPSAVLPCLPTGRVSVPLNRNRPSPLVNKTVPKIIKQAAKKLVTPIAKRPVNKTVIGPKPLTSSNSAALTDPVIASNLLACKEPEISKPEVCSTSVSDISKNDTSTSSIPVKESSMPEGSEVSKEISEPAIESLSSSSVPPEVTVKSGTEDSVSESEKDTVPVQNNEIPSAEIEHLKPVCLSSPTKDLLSPSAEVMPKESSAPCSPKDESTSHSPKQELDETAEDENAVDVPNEIAVEEADQKKENDSAVPEDLPEANDKTSDAVTEAVADKEVPSPVPCDEKEEAPKSPVSSTKLDTSNDDSENTISNQVSAVVEESKPSSPTNENKNVPMKIMSTQRTDHSPMKPVNLSTTDQEKQLQPINDAEISSGKASPKANSQNKSEGGSQTSEAPTRSFTSISDAVRFSLMDMDDATDSVENQVVLQAFQTSRASSPASPAYAASESGEERNSASPSSAVMLSAPQSTSTTELNVSSRVSQRFEPTVHCSQAEKFTECQNTVSRTTSWILEDTITEASPSVTVQKSPDVDSCGEGKDDDKPKKKRKKKERVDNDITHKFWCQICSKGFFSAYNLRRHCRNVHKMVLPKGSSDVPFANSSQCLPHIQQADTTTSETSSSRLSYGNVQTSCVSPNKGSEYSLMSPTHESKNQEFSVKTGQHVPQIQSAEFQMQTPPRMTSQSSSTHISPVTPPKDFRLGTPTSVSSPQISPNKMSPVKSAPPSKFQRLPTGSQVPQMAKISQMQQIALCGQQALQQQRQIGQLQSPGLIQPLPSVACQAQQMQASQCPHFQANKQIVQQRIGQLQLMHHVAQLPSVPHAAHGIQKPAQTQSFKKCSTNQPASKISENEQMQQAAQLAQNQQLLANQQMQKLIQIRQNAIAASGIASQLSLANAIPSVPGSPVKGATQCFQSQLAAARQAAVVGQIPTAQRAQGTSYNLPSHDTSSHQFFSPAVQPSQDQTSCPHSSFSAQNMSEFSANAPSYPTIRLSSEANDGLEDLEQFLLENMPWSGEQSSAHGLSQQSGNRPSSADSLTLSIPSQASTTSQNRGVASKGKTSISRPKPRKPVAASCSKNLLGNLGRGVKKKTCAKKISKSSDTECATSKPEVFTQANLVQPPHELKQCNKETIGNISNFSKQNVKNSAVGMLNETDSSDSVQCINVTHNAPPKHASVGINFNIFSPAGLCASEKNADLMCNPSSCKEAYDGQRKSSFLDHSNLVGTSSSNLDQNKSSININQCETSNPINMGSAFNPTGKSSTSMKPFCPAATTPYGITNETPNPQDIFLGQRNSETSDSNNSDQKIKKGDTNSDDLNSNMIKNSRNTLNTLTSAEMMREKAPLDKNLFLGGSLQSSDEKSELSVDDGKSERSVSDGKSEQSVADGKFEHSVAYGNSGRSVPDGKSEISDVDGKSEISVPDGKCELSAADRKHELSAADGKHELSVADGKSELSVADGKSELSVADGKSEQSVADGKSEISIDEEEIKQNIAPESAKHSDVCKIGKNKNVLIESKETTSDSEEIPNSKIDDETSINTIVSNENTLLPEGNDHDGKNTCQDQLDVGMKNNVPESDNRFINHDVNINSIINANSKENKIISSNLDSSKLDIVPETSDLVLKNSIEENSFIPKVVNHDKHSSHEDTISNDENHLPKKNDLENIGSDIGLSRVALRVRKSQDTTNKFIENDKNVPFFVTEKDDIKTPIIKKSSKKKKVKQENRKDENIISDTKISFKLDNDSKIQKTGLLNNVNKEKDLNRSLCMITSCYEGIKKNSSIENEGHDNGFCLDEKQLEEASIDGIPAARLRLRDTPKTSVKRVCPCCADAKLPKKCRANGGGNISKIIGSKVSNSLKNKSTLKSRNTTNGHNGKVNTRSSQRLRSRNNAIS